MATVTLSDAKGAPVAGERSAPILVATRGDPGSDGAIELAFALAGATGSPVRVLAAVPAVPACPPQVGPPIQLPSDELDGSAALRRKVEAQLRRLGGCGMARRIATDIRIGDAPPLIVRVAREVGARLILLGTAEHDVLHRLCGADTAARVARAADVPVMVVPRSCGQLPESALIAVDFSDVSVQAGRVALTLFRDLDAIHLVHVAPSPQPALELIPSSEGRYVECAEQAFNEVRDALPLSACTVVGREVVRGSPARELVRVARERRVDLIVAGSHGHGALQRLLVGSVATGLLRAARVPVLVLPARAHAANSSVDAHAVSENRFSGLHRRLDSVGETLTRR